MSLFWVHAEEFESVSSLLQDSLRLTSIVEWRVADVRFIVSKR